VTVDRARPATDAHRNRRKPPRILKSWPPWSSGTAYDSDAGCRRRARSQSDLPAEHKKQKPIRVLSESVLIDSDVLAPAAVVRPRPDSEARHAARGQRHGACFHLPIQAPLSAGTSGTSPHDSDWQIRGDLERHSSPITRVNHPAATVAAAAAAGHLFQPDLRAPHQAPPPSIAAAAAAPLQPGPPLSSDIGMGSQGRGSGIWVQIARLLGSRPCFAGPETPACCPSHSAGPCSSPAPPLAHHFPSAAARLQSCCSHWTPTHAPAGNPRVGSEVDGC
jgi:hypothetical protein